MLKKVDLYAGLITQYLLHNIHSPLNENHTFIITQVQSACSSVITQCSPHSGHHTVVITQWSSHSGHHKVVTTKWSSHSGHHKVVITQWSSHSGHHTVVTTQWSPQSGHHKVVIPQWSSHSQVTHLKGVWGGGGAGFGPRLAMIGFLGTAAIRLYFFASIASPGICCCLIYLLESTIHLLMGLSSKDKGC